MEEVNRDRRAADSRQTAIDALARELDLPVEQVERIYRDEVKRIEVDARIKTFVNVLATSRVRAELMQQRRSR